VANPHATSRDDTAPTEEDGLVDALRAQGILGPFRVADWGAQSDTGHRRERNEDRFRADPAIGVVVADGMGGHAGGELAADITTHVAFRLLAGLREAAARDLVERANAEVVRAGAEHGYERLGSTLVALAVHRNHVVVVNVGDSRAYRLRDGELELLTRDHSVRAELDAAGIPLAAAESAHVRLDALTAHIGQRSEFTPSYQAASFSVMAGDRFLMCTDGIHGQLTPDAMQQALGATTCAAACAALIEAAAAAGGRDNATAAVFEFGAESVGRPG
jgi:serine/threonine protein phosphatase PrpC